MAEVQDQQLVKLITGRQSKLESEKSGFNDRTQDVADYVCPHRDDILGGNKLDSDRKGSKIYDGTAVSAAILAADGIHGYHISPAFPWFKYTMNRKEVNKIPEVKNWLEELEFNMYMALNRSNFYSEMWSFIYDGFTLGTASIFPEEDIAQGRIVFEAVHPGEIFIQENKYGEVDILHRKRRLTARKIAQMFGLDNCSEAVKIACENSPFTEFEMIHAIYPREEYDDRKMDAKNKPYASVWMLTAGNHICRVSGMSKNRYNVWRYLKTGKSPWGVSPAHLAMSDIRGLNLMGKTLLGAAQLAVDPAYNVPDYLEGKVQLKPRGLNYMQNQGDAITRINGDSNFPVGIDREQAKQKSIRERFHVDTFLMLANLEGRGQRTAYEVSEMMAEKAAVLGAELGPLNSTVDTILDDVFEIEKAAGRMPAPPDILIQMGEEDPHLRFDPVYQGPLAQAQRERFLKDGRRKFFMDVTSLVQVDPTIVDNFNLDNMAINIADESGLQQNEIRKPEERDQIRQGRAQQAAADQQTQAFERMAPAAKEAVQANNESGGSLAEMMMGAGGV